MDNTQFPDVTNDEHWTKSGNVKLDAARAAWDMPELTADGLKHHLPDGFNRSNAHAAPTIERPNEDEPLPPEMSDHDAHVLELMGKAVLEDESRVDAVALMEAAVAAANGDRYIRNNALMGIARGFQASQAQIRDMQDRLDARIKARHDAEKEEETEE